MSYILPYYPTLTMNTFLKMCMIMCLLIPSPYVFGQVDNTDNLGFEKGNFDGWELSYGTVKLVNNKIQYQNTQNGTIQSRHLIVSKNDGNDPKITNEAIPMAGKEGKYAMRIGKTLNGSTWERATTSFIVTADHSLFQYHFAVLLQEDNGTRHTNAEKPGFALKITDLSGTQISCGDFDVQLANGLLSGFKVQGSIEYRNWTTGAIDLAKHIGKTLKVEVTAHGCTGLSHFGYAYFDSELIKSEVKQASICPDISGNMTLIAPDGFEKYQWNNGYSGKAISEKVALDKEFTVTITPFATLDATCNFDLHYKVPFKTSTSEIKKTLCEGEHFEIDHQIYNQTGNFTKIITRGGVCDSTINLALIINPIPRIYPIYNKCEGENVKIRDSVITTSGNYRITIKRPGKCDSVINADINFEILEIKSSADRTITKGDKVILEGQLVAGTQGESNWYEGSELICGVCNTITITPLKDNSYFFETFSQTKICKRTDTTNIKVMPCTVHFPDSFSPNSDLINAKFYGLGDKCISKIITLEIFDRWGCQVFITNNIPPSDESFGWDGKMNGKELSAGIYVYMAKAQLLDGSIEQYEGSINLFR